jgi:hypothetical protein
MQISFFGPTGSGKTMSALLMAAGLSPDGKVTVIDTERGRASLYADNRRVLSALPQGFDVLEIDQPYHPKTYIEAIGTVEASGYKVCIIDSGSDSWDGPGGCTDIAEKDKGWNKAKLWNKRMMTRAALSDMHIIWLLKAQEKTKVLSKEKSGTGKQEYIDLGVLPIWEKNNFYPMLLGFSVDPKTHLSTAVKCHDDLWQYFKDPKLITKEDGERLRRWNESGIAMEPTEQVRKRARVAAEDGIEAYQAFFASLTTPQKKVLVDTGDHADNKLIAQKAEEESRVDSDKRAIGEQPDGTLKVA